MDKAVVYLMGKLPRHGIDWHEVLHKLISMVHRLPNHLEHGIIGSMTTFPHPLAQFVYSMYQLFNANDVALYSEVRNLELEAVEMLGEILGCENCVGMITTGGSEANLAALYLAREHGYTKVYIARTAHDSLFKAIKLLKLDAVEVKYDSYFRIDPDDFEKKCVENGAGILVTTLGTTGTGSVDRVAELSSIAKRCNVVIHVDAALGGFVIPFINAELGEVFRYQNVVSATMDPHKLGLVPIPAGGLVVRDEQWFSPLYFESRYMPARYQIGILGTRNAGSIAATWAMLMYMGWDGYRRQALSLFERTRFLVENVRSSGFEVVGEALAPVVCIPIEHESKALEYLWSKGLYVYRCGIVRGIRIVVMPHVRREHLETVVRELRNFIDT